MVGAALASLLWLPVVCLLGLREPNPGQRAPGAQGAVSFQSKESHLNDRQVGGGRGGGVIRLRLRAPLRVLLRVPIVLYFGFTV